jgi:hypothetical protein
MSNPWVLHVKDYAKKNNLSYMCAMSQPACKASYKKPTPVKKIKTIEVKDNEIPKFINTFRPQEKKIEPAIRKQMQIDFQKRKEEIQNKLKKIQDDYYNKLVEIYKTRKRLNDNDKKIIDDFRYENKIITGYDNLITFNEFKKKQK